MQQESDIEQQHDLSSFLGISSSTTENIIAPPADYSMHSFVTHQTSDHGENSIGESSAAFLDDSFLAIKSHQNRSIQGDGSEGTASSTSGSEEAFYQKKDVFTELNGANSDKHTETVNPMDKQGPLTTPPLSFKDQMRHHRATEIESTLETNPPLAQAVALSFSLSPLPRESPEEQQLNQTQKSCLRKGGIQFVLVFFLAAAAVSTSVIFASRQDSSSGLSNGMNQNTTFSAPIVDIEDGKPLVLPLLEQQVKLLPEGLQPYDRFGESAALSGDLLVVGSVHTDANNTEKSGIVHVYRRTRGIWNEETILLPSDPHENLRFGRSVAIEGNTIVVGAYFDNHKGPYSGSAYIFESTDDGSWRESQKIVALDAAEDALFGIRVAIRQRTIVVTASNDRNHTGSAYLFEKLGDQWTQVQKITASDGSPGIYFGYSLAFGDNLLVIGARNGDAEELYSGSVYIFRKSQGVKWIEQQKLWADDTIVEDSFGYSVSVSGNTLLVGAPGDNDNGSSSGSAYVFVYDGSSWIQSQKLLRPTKALNHDRFGHSVAIDSSNGQRFLVGARNTQSQEFAGNGYVYEQQSDGIIWKALYELYVSGKQDNEVAGFVSVFDDGTIVVTSPFSATTIGERSGIGYIFRL